MLKGKLFATKDVNTVFSLVGYGAKALYMGDKDSGDSIPKGIDFIYPMSLVPSYDILSHFINNDLQRYEAEYHRYLNRPLAHEAIATIIGSLYFGNNIVMLFPQDVEMLGYPSILLNELANVYGITAETKTSQFYYDISKNTFNLRLMYLYNIINAVDFILASDTLDDVVINKLRKEIPSDWCVPTDINNMEFTEVIESRKQEIIRFGKVLPSLVSKI